MKRIWGVMISVLTAAALLTGCGGRQDVAYALVTGEHDYSGSKAAAEAWNGVQSFASAGTGIAGRYEIETDDTEAAAEAMRSIIKSGAGTVVCVGRRMETVLYEAQTAHTKTRFIMLGGEPKADAESDAVIADNTLCLTYDDGEAGYLAGYGAVCEGFRHLSFMAGSRSNQAVRYAVGYIRGICDAADDLALGASDVVVEVLFTGEDKLTPRTMERALELYDDGSEIIMGCGDAILQPVIKAAESRGGRVISAGQDKRAESATVLFGIEFVSAEAVEAALSECAGEDFTGGVIRHYGAAQNSVNLAVDMTMLSGLTAEIYNRVYQELADGTRTVPEDEALSGSERVTVSIL